jgi:hypothetical protein
LLGTLLFEPLCQPGANPGVGGWREPSGFHHSNKEWRWSRARGSGQIQAQQSPSGKKLQSTIGGETGLCTQVQSGDPLLTQAPRPIIRTQCTQDPALSDNVPSRNIIRT